MQTLNEQVVYVVASCKEWHRPAFDVIAQEMPGQWFWVGNTAELEAVVAKCLPRYIFFIHWNWLVPESIFSTIECVCFHMTDVPYGRGGSPLQNLIVRGLKTTQLTALRMVRDMDAGPVYAKRPLDLSGRAEEIYQRAGELSFEVIRDMITDQPQPAPQEGEVIVFRRRTPDQSLLPALGQLEQLYDHIRMLDAPGYPAAFIDYGGVRIEFSHAELGEGELRAKVRIRLFPHLEPDKE